MLWRLLGPHYYVLRASADLFALIIVVCSCVVATRHLRRTPGLAAIFCITVALEASGPSTYGWLHDFGMSLFYDRLLMAALSVLFAQSFTNDLDSRREHDWVDRFIAAFLLNLLFLLKISGLVLGLAIVVGGHLVRGRFSRSLIDTAAVLLLLVVMLAIDFVITGTSFYPVLHEYRIAAQARISSNSILDVVSAGLRLQVFGAVVLMVFYAVSRPDKDSVASLWRCAFVLVFFWASQVALNISNDSPALLYLAPAAVVALITWTDASEPSASEQNLWRRFDPRQLGQMPVRAPIPLLIVALIAVPEALSSLRALELDHSVSAGRASPIAVTANKGITFNVLRNSEFALSMNRAVQAIEGLGVSHDAIASVDFMNPFPALLLSPSPKGVLVVWNFGVNVPIGYKPSWQEVIGDACVVAEPKLKPFKVLIDAVQPHLMSAFTLVHEDDMWKIWKSSTGCDATGKANRVVARTAYSR
ncbi:MAG TPA: hypothetical protein VEY94_13285 [Patescibacteria group bacterium]|nr:hypothetical protein [Patescibacteria group bacterium]